MNELCLELTQTQTSNPGTFEADVTVWLHLGKIHAGLYSVHISITTEEHLANLLSSLLLTCHFCSSMIRVVEFLLVAEFLLISSFISVSQHSSPSLVNFKLFCVSTVWFTLFLSHKHQNQNEIQYWNAKSFHWQLVTSISYRNEGKFLKVLRTFCQADMTFISHIPFLQYAL